MLFSTPPLSSILSSLHVQYFGQEEYFRTLFKSRKTLKQIFKGIKDKFNTSIVKVFTIFFILMENPILSKVVVVSKPTLMNTL